MRRRGLTVVEALVATAIVLVVLAVGIPAATALTGGARRSACAERLRALGAGLAMYANDHEGWLPPATTVERGYAGVRATDLENAPGRLRASMTPYLPMESAWYCPLDPEARKNVLWLGQRHFFSSYRFAPKPSPESPPWPPKAQIGEGEILVSDAFGIPSKDSARRFRDEKGPASNHADGTVNAIRNDLSLARRKARDLVGD